MQNNQALCGFCEQSSSFYDCYIEDEHGLETAFYEKQGDKTSQIIRACKNCATNLNGSEISKRKGSDSAIHTLFFEHDDYKTLSYRHMIPLMAKLLLCNKCDNPIGKNPDSRFRIARQLLRMNPSIRDNGQIVFTCVDCYEKAKDEKGA